MSSGDAYRVSSQYEWSCQGRAGFVGDKTGSPSVAGDTKYLLEVVVQSSTKLEIQSF
jgi:hypothetical protein